MEGTLLPGCAELPGLLFGAGQLRGQGFLETSIKGRKCVQFLGCSEIILLGCRGASVGELEEFPPRPPPCVGVASCH